MSTIDTVTERSKVLATVKSVEAAVDQNGNRRENRRGNQWSVITIELEDGTEREMPIWEPYETVSEEYPVGERGLFVFETTVQTRHDFKSALMGEELEALGL